jgi:hypothetical protein
MAKWRECSIGEQFGAGTPAPRAKFSANNTTFELGGSGYSCVAKFSCPENSGNFQIGNYGGGEKVVFDGENVCLDDLHVMSAMALEAKLAAARAEGYAQGVRDAASWVQSQDGYDDIDGVHSLVEGILTLLNPDTPAPPSPDAVVKAALEWAAEAIGCGCSRGVCEYPAKCPESDVAELLTAASDPATLDQIIAQAGKDRPHD